MTLEVFFLQKETFLYRSFIIVCVIISKILLEFFVLWKVMDQTHMCALSNQFEYQITSPLLYGIPGTIPL